MANFNSVVLIGHLTKDPKTNKTTKTGASVTNGTIAVNRIYTTKEGKKAEETTFVEFEAWAKQGEIVSQYCKKGTPLLIQGRLKQNSWTTAEGEKRSRLVIVAERVQLMGKKNGPSVEAEPTGAEQTDVPF